MFLNWVVEKVISVRRFERKQILLVFKNLLRHKIIWFGSYIFFEWFFLHFLLCFLFVLSCFLFFLWCFLFFVWRFLFFLFSFLGLGFPRTSREFSEKSVCKAGFPAVYVTKEGKIETVQNNWVRFIYFLASGRGMWWFLTSNSDSACRNPPLGQFLRSYGWILILSLTYIDR